jgi:hypothetical protein
LNALAFSRDRRWLASGGTGDILRIWDLAAILPAAIPLLITHSDYEPAYVDSASPGAANSIKLGPLKSDERMLQFTVFTPKPVRRYPRWASFLMALVPISAALYGWWRHRKYDQQRKAFLDQWETYLDLEPVRVHTSSQEEQLFQGPEVATLARDLRRRRAEPTSQIAVEPTVRRTAARAGLFSPVPLERRIAREYLVLLESKGGRDQQARFWGCLLERLAAREVWLDCYWFSGDPRVCEVPDAEREWVRLEEISAVHPRHELWVVASAGRFFDPTTRQPAPWLPALSRWSERAVLSLTAGRVQDREQLARLGFTFAPASITGVAELSSDAAQKRKEDSSALYPALLESDELRWLQGPAPADEAGERELRTLDRQLRAWLGGDGYRLLLACSVYPGLAWNLTLHLALELIPAEEREATLARLVRLPWFRHSRMPHWLRAYFAEKLEAKESERVMTLLRGFLDRKTEGPGRASGLEFVARRDIAQDLRAQNQPPTRDYVFLSFLLGRKPRLQDLEAPSWLRTLLYPQGLPALGFRREFWLAAAVLVGAIVFGGAEAIAKPKPKVIPPSWTEVPLPAGMDTTPANGLAARALEIAHARLGQPVAAGFADAVFDQAAQFGATRGDSRPAASLRAGNLFLADGTSAPSAILEGVSKDGVVLLEPYEGRLRLVFRNPGRGRFMEVGEGNRGLSAAVAQLVAGRTWVLAVGVSKYQKVPSLMYAASDAQLFSQFFSSQRGDPASVRLLTDEQATTTAIRAALNTLANTAGPADTIVFTFSGHGALAKSGSDTWVGGTDMDPQSVETTAISLSDLRSALSQSSAAKVIGFFDFAHSGTAQSPVRPVPDLSSPLKQVFFSASRDKEVSFEDPKLGGGHGAFSYFAIKGLSGDADVNHDGAVTVNELNAYLATQVPKATDGKQHPTYTGNMAPDAVVARVPGK